MPHVLFEVRSFHECKSLCIALWKILQILIFNALPSSMLHSNFNALEMLKRMIDNSLQSYTIQPTCACEIILTRLISAPCHSTTHFDNTPYKSTQQQAHQTRNRPLEEPFRNKMQKMVNKAMPANKDCALMP